MNFQNSDSDMSTASFTSAMNLYFYVRSDKVILMRPMKFSLEMKKYMTLYRGGNR